LITTFANTNLKPKLKILSVCNTLNRVSGGGEAERSFQLALHFTVHGADCRVLTLNAGSIPTELSGKVNELSRWNKRFNIPRASFSTILNYVKNVDIIHMTGHWSLLNVMIYLAARIEKKPYIVCPGGSLLIFGRSKIFKKLYNFIIGKRILKNAAFCIAITDYERQQFRDYGVSESKIKVIANGVNATDFSSNDSESFRKKYNLKKPFLLFLGRLSPIKGPDLLLKAFNNIQKEFQNIDLVFVGPDEGLLDDLKKLATENNLTERVHFIGYLGGNDKSNAYHSALMLVVPSRHEAMSIVALESGICGTPVLLTDQCGFDEIEKNGGGWVVSADIQDLTAGLKKALSDPEKIKQASTHIKKYTSENYSWDKATEKYFFLFYDSQKN
jgi:glycosyltransferase involved in cell wall biosynthesis